MKIIILLIVFGCTCSSILYGQDERPSRSYYLNSVVGNDSNDGLSIKSPWKTLAKVQKLRLDPGDKILLCRGNTFKGILNIQGSGNAQNRILIDAYGSGKKPAIVAPDNSLYAVLVTNSDYLTVQNLDISNKGSKRLAYRTGLKVLSMDHGTSRNIVLNALDIHDVSGSLIKHEGGGSGILIENKFKTKVSIFDSLIIENCTLRRCERNAIIWSAPWDRKNWHPSTHTIVRKNLIEEVPGDGIVPIGCDGVLIEYNLMRNCTALLDIKEAAAGIWPWSCDNTIIQYNEVSDHKAPWDGQGYDADFNCKNTTIQYNHSHDNDGGFVLICNAGKVDTTSSVGNIGTVVQYNISINDGLRTNKTHTGDYFSPTVHIGGPCKDTRINNNVVQINDKISKNVDRTLIASKSWDGYADNTTFSENLFFAAQPSNFEFTQSTRNVFTGNYYLGIFTNKPVDEKGKSRSMIYESMIKKDPTGFNALSPLMISIPIAAGAASLRTVDKKAIEKFFTKLKNDKIAP